MVRALVIGSAAAAFSALLGAPLIDWLRSRGMGKAISDEGPESHQSKAGTPTMGGLLVLATILAFTLPTNLGSRGVMEKIGLTYEREIEWKSLPHVFYRATREAV